MWPTMMVRDGIEPAFDAYGPTVHVPGHLPRRIRRWQRRLRPADVPRAGPSDLISCPASSARAMALAGDRGVAVALADGRYALPGGRERHTPVAADPLLANPPTPVAARLVLLMAIHPARSHQAWADALGVTRSRVTQILARVGPDDPDTALRWWLADEPRTTGWALYLYSDASPWEQAARLCAHFDAHLQPGDPPAIIGGELAGDVHAPWTSPQLATVRARRIVGVPPEFVAADSPETATAVVLLDTDPLDRTLAQEASTPIGARLLAHPATALADIAALTPDDRRRDEQMAALIATIRRTAGAQRQAV